MSEEMEIENGVSSTSRQKVSATLEDYEQSAERFQSDTRRYLMQHLLDEYPSVGQAVEVSVHATNILPTTMYDVYCDISGVGEPGIVSLDSSSVARGVLAPGGTADFRACYTTLDAGTTSTQAPHKVA